VRDISALAAVPRLILVEPCAESEVRQVGDFCLNRTVESSYIRLVSLGWPLPFALPADSRLELGRGVVVREGRDAVVFGYGPWLLANAFEAAERLERDHGLNLTLVNLPWLNRVDAAGLRQTIGQTRRVITLDNHYVHGGQGEMIAAHIGEMGLSGVQVTPIGVTELPECGANDEVLRYHRLDADGLAQAFAATLQQAAV
jgi:transketolase